MKLQSCAKTSIWTAVGFNSKQSTLRSPLQKARFEENETYKHCWCCVFLFVPTSMSNALWWNNLPCLWVLESTKSCSARAVPQKTLHFPAISLKGVFFMEIEQNARHNNSVFNKVDPAHIENTKWILWPDFKIKYHHYICHRSLHCSKGTCSWFARNKSKLRAHANNSSCLQRFQFQHIGLGNKRNVTTQQTNLNILSLLS